MKFNVLSWNSKFYMFCNLCWYSRIW